MADFRKWLVALAVLALILGFMGSADGYSAMVFMPPAQCQCLNDIRALDIATIRVEVNRDSFEAALEVLLEDPGSIPDLRTGPFIATAMDPTAEHLVAQVPSHLVATALAPGSPGMKVAPSRKIVSYAPT